MQKADTRNALPAVLIFRFDNQGQAINPIQKGMANAPIPRPCRPSQKDKWAPAPPSQL